MSDIMLIILSKCHKIPKFIYVVLISSWYDRIDIKIINLKQFEVK